MSNKGSRAEEVLREYFLSSHYFVVRGAPLMHQSLDVTDVDLWLYHRPSAVVRHRANVDIKYKAKAKAMERVLWAKGLQGVLGLDQAIVATTDKRSGVKEFGRINEVTVLDGNFVGRLMAKAPEKPARLSEEEFFDLLPKGDSKLVNDWAQVVKDAKTRLLNRLDFDGANVHLRHVHSFLGGAPASADPETMARLGYLMTAYALITIDFCLKDLAFDEPGRRRQAISDGFVFGQGGRRRASELATIGAKLAAHAMGKYDLVDGLRQQHLDFMESFGGQEILAEFFSTHEVARTLVETARSFDSHAYAREFVPPQALTAEEKAVIGVLLDYNEVSRSKFYDTFEKRP